MDILIKNMELSKNCEERKMEKEKLVEKKSIYEETYDWIFKNLNECNSKACLIAIASNLSSVIHGLYGKPNPTITDVLCGIRNAIWEWDATRQLEQTVLEVNDGSDN